MIVHTDLASFPANARGGSLTIGNFDGVHLGHRRLIAAIRAEADRLRSTATVLTFDPHPSHVLRPHDPVAPLFTREDMIEQMRALGVDHLILQPFTETLANTTAHDFVFERIAKSIAPKVIVVGYDFTFGRDRGGNLEQLRAWGEKLGFTCLNLEPVEVEGSVVSSSRIRRSLQDGDVRLAADLLGRPYRLFGRVVRGDGRGRQISFPTANLRLENPLLLRNGVYGTRIETLNGVFDSVTNVGTRPTFKDGDERHVETHLLNADGDLYGQPVKLDFIFRIRDELKFSSAHELMKQIADDVKSAELEFKRTCSVGSK